MPRADLDAVPPAARPFFIVGAPRSGTTLLRVMLDSHPRLAVPPESHFLVQGPGPCEPVGAALARVLAHPRFLEWALDPSAVREQVAERAPDTYGELAGVLYELFAAAHGKRRWGDKTPSYVHYVPQLLALFPDAQFIHVIRDGREVAASLAEQPWGPTSPISGAIWWRRALARRRHLRRLGPHRYHEVRLEALLAAPDETLRSICAFLGEDFAEEMLDYHRTARARVPDTVSDHSNLSRPPTAGLRADWAVGMSRTERAAVAATCHRQLRRLGYAAPVPSPAGYLWAGIHLARTWWGEVCHPEWRLPHLAPGWKRG